MNPILHLVTVVDNLLQKFLILLMGLLLVDVTWQVITRFVLPQPSSFTEELARFLLIWIGLLGSAHAYRHKMHLGISYMADKLQPQHKRVMNVIVQIVVGIFAISVLIYGGVQLAFLAFDLKQVSASMRINVGWVYMALPLSGILLLLFSIEQALVNDEGGPPVNEDQTSTDQKED